ncbi:hypothetical protein Pelo_3456 [Pelomyxa schiedti]|nr:hypothetical protein Pelo_3456 [Pelomyxa schiedti]
MSSVRGEVHCHQVTIWFSPYNLYDPRCPLLSKADDRSYDLLKECKYIKCTPDSVASLTLRRAFPKDAVVILNEHHCQQTALTGWVARLEVVGISFHWSTNPVWWIKQDLLQDDDKTKDCYLFQHALLLSSLTCAYCPPQIEPEPLEYAGAAISQAFIMFVESYPKIREGRILRYSKQDNTLQTVPERRGNTLIPPEGISSSVCTPLNDAIFVHPSCISHLGDLLAVGNGVRPGVQLIDLSAGQVYAYFNATMGGVRSIAINPPEEGKSLPEIHVGTTNGIWVIKPTWQENSRWNTTQVRTIPGGVDSLAGHDIVVSGPRIAINGTHYQWFSFLTTIAVVNLRTWHPKSQDRNVLVYAEKVHQQPDRFRLVWTPIGSPTASNQHEPEPCESGVAQQPTNKRPRTSTLADGGTPYCGRAMSTASCTVLPMLETNVFLKEEFKNMLDFNIDPHNNVLCVLGQGYLHFFEAPFTTSSLLRATTRDIPPLLPPTPLSLSSIAAATTTTPTSTSSDSY